MLAIQKRAYEAGWEDGYFRTPHRTQWIDIGPVNDYDDGYDDGASACPSHSHLARLHTDYFILQHSIGRIKLHGQS